MTEFSRRALLTRGSLTAAGALGAMAIPNAAMAVMREEPELTEAEKALLASSLVIHLRDIQTGELEILVGENSIVYTDKKLVARMLRAAK